MKKLLFLLLTLISIQSYAQLSRTAIFNFSKPDSLKPAVVMEDYAGFYVDVSDQIFTDRLASVSFLGTATMLTWTQGNDDAVYYLALASSASMCVKVSGGSHITKIEMSKVASLTANVGTYSTTASPDCAIWTPSDNNTSEVYFTHKGQEPVIEFVKVYYDEPNITLSPTNVFPSPTDQPMTFDSLELTFGNAIGSLSVVNTSGFTIVGDYDNQSYGSLTATMTPSVSENKAILTLSPEIQHDGTFTITVPASSFRDEEGYVNVPFTTTVTVKENRATFDTLSVKVLNAENEYVYLNNKDIYTFPEEIYLEFNSNIEHIDTDCRMRLFREGTTDPVAQMKLSLVEGKRKMAKLVFHTQSEDIFAKGVYRVTIPQQVIFNSNYQDPLYERYNPEIELTFNYTEAPDPLQPKWDKFENLKKEAAELYLLIGVVGYPLADDATNPLEAVKDMELPTKEDELDQAILSLNAAISAFYNCTTITLPAKEKWYTIASVNKENAELPLSFVDGGVTIGGTPTAFQIEDITDAGFVLRLKVAKDEKGNDVYNYLHLLIGQNLYSGMSTTNVLSETSYLTNLTLGKMLLPVPTDGPAPDQSIVAGLITINGPMGNLKASGDAVAPTYALVKHGDTPEIATDPEKNTLLFESDLTHAFRFVETKEPQIKPEVTPTFELSEVDMTTHTMTLTIGVVTSATLSDASKVKVMQGNTDVTSKITADKLIEAVADTLTQFTIHVDGLEVGTYSLYIEKGAFTYEKDNVNESDVTLLFEIPDPSSRFVKNFEFYGWPLVSGDTPLHETVLNNIFVYIRKGQVYQDMCVDSNKTITLIDGWNDEIKYREGKLEYYPDFALPEEYGGKDSTLVAYIIRWNPEIKPGEFDGKPFLARVVFPEASFGNEYFGRWLNGEKADSVIVNVVVNGRIGMTFKIDNQAAADQAAADAVIAKINAIGTVEYTDECKARIDAARAAYDALTNVQKALVPKETLKILTDAEATYEELKQAAGINNISVDYAQEKVIFDLQGRRVAATTSKGIYIVNGKKIIKK